MESKCHNLNWKWCTNYTIHTVYRTLYWNRPWWTSNPSCGTFMRRNPCHIHWSLSSLTDPIDYYSCTRISFCTFRFTAPSSKLSIAPPLNWIYSQRARDTKNSQQRYMIGILLLPGRNIKNSKKGTDKTRKWQEKELRLQRLLLIIGSCLFAWWPEKDGDWEGTWTSDHESSESNHECFSVY